MPESKSSPRRIAARERQRLALELRKTGDTFDTIAEKLHYRSRQAAAYAVNAALERITTEPAEELRKLDLERLDTYLLALEKQIRKGNTWAINTALAVLNRRAKLLGLDMPIPIEHSGKIQHEQLPDLADKSDAEIKATLEQLEKFLGIERSNS